MKKILPILVYSLIILLFSPLVYSADVDLPGISIDFGGKSDVAETATAFKLLLTMTVLSLAPSLIILMSSFTRIIIVLSMLRHAFGMQQTPPNTVLISLALILTVFNMSPVFKEINENSFQPYLAGKLATEKAIDLGMKPLRTFMVSQTREQDMAVILEINKQEAPDNIDDLEHLQLIAAFLLSELKTAFQIGFVIFLPFLLVDLVVASILMSMGMIMVPPMMISLPLKILMFVLIDGWALVVQSLLNSFQ